MTDDEGPSRRRPLLDRKRSERRFLRGAMGALAVAALVAFAAFASGLVDWAIQEGRGTPFVIQDINYSELATWWVIAGTLALIACFFLLRLGAARTLTAILALCFFVLVVALDILFTLKETDGGVLSARRVGVVEAAVFLIAIAAVLGQLDAARRGTGATALTTATAFLALGLVLFASAIWVFGGGWLGVPAGTPRPQSAPVVRLEPSEENIRHIIARELQVPEDRVMPDARFDTDLNAHEVDMQEMVELRFQRVFGLDYRAGDENMLITVQDAFDYVAAPAEFRATHRGQSRYRKESP
jgi:acyl carrier protein